MPKSAIQEEDGIELRGKLLTRGYAGTLACGFAAVLLTSHGVRMPFEAVQTKKDSGPYSEEKGPKADVGVIVSGVYRSEIS